MRFFVYLCITKSTTAMTFIEAVLQDAENIRTYPAIKNPTLDGIEALPLGERIHMLYSFIDNDGEYNTDLIDKNRLRLLEFKAELEFIKIANKPGTKTQSQKRVKAAWADLVKQTRDKQLAQLV